MKRKLILIIMVLGIILCAGGFDMNASPQCYCDCEYCCHEPKPVEEVEETPAPRYGFTEQEILWLAQLLCGSGTKDGDGEYDFDFQEEVNYTEVCKVLNVVMNRVRDSRFPNTVEEVIFARNQFTAMKSNQHKTPSDKAIQVVTDWCAAYDRYDPGAQGSTPEDHVYYSGNGYINTTRARY